MKQHITFLLSLWIPMTQLLMCKIVQSRRNSSNDNRQQIQLHIINLIEILMIHLEIEEMHMNLDELLHTLIQNIEDSVLDGQGLITDIQLHQQQEISHYLCL